MQIPAWNDVGAYEYLSEASNFQWRWEFLRRCPLYVSDWQECARKPLLPGMTDDEASIPHADFAYGIIGPAPRPSVRCPADLERRMIEPANGAIVGEGRHISTPAYDGELIFNLRADLPIGPQLARVKATLERHKACLAKKSRGKSAERDRDRWTLYLRMLDARAAGETHESIGRELLGYGNPEDEAYDESIATEVSRRIGTLKGFWRRIPLKP